MKYYVPLEKHLFFWSWTEGLELGDSTEGL